MELIETRNYIDCFPASVVAVENSSDILIPDPFNMMVFLSGNFMFFFSHRVLMFHDDVLKATAKHFLGRWCSEK